MTAASTTDDESLRRVRRARRVLALTASPNEHEARAAREQFARLVASGDATLAEACVPEVGEVAVDGCRDVWREQLALAVAGLYGCAAERRLDGIAVVGDYEAAREAAGLYALALRAVERAASVPGTRVETELWRRIAWMSFVVTVGDRVSRLAPRKEAQKTDEREETGAVAPDEQAKADEEAQKTQRLYASLHPAMAAYIAERAGAAGDAAGTRLPMRAWRPPPKPPRPARVAGLLPARSPR